MKRLACLVVFLLSLAPILAWADGVGVVLIHGKQGLPGEQFLALLTQRMEHAGFMVDQPAMCWARTRIYDRTLPECMADIGAAIARLKSRGATAFAVAGHSLGGFGAIYYGSTHEGLKGIVALAPAPGPGVARRSEIVTGKQRAQNLIAAGQGDAFQTFEDTNTGPRGVVTIQVRATPKIFMSFFDMSGPANLVANTARLKAPVLWVSGTRDPSQIAREIDFDRAPPNPLNRYARINSGHMDTPDNAADLVVAWLQDATKR